MRVVIPDAFSESQCKVCAHFLSLLNQKELLHIQRSLSVEGYVKDLTLAAMRELWGKPELCPLIPVRGRSNCQSLFTLSETIREIAEESFYQQFCLNFEFTGLMCWEEGASMEPHYDRFNLYFIFLTHSNRDYLVQRHYTALLYLNSSGVDYEGGEFEFCDEQGTASMELKA